MRFLTLAALALAANAANAESMFENLDKFYVGGGVNFVDANTSDSAGNDIGFTTIEAVGGYKHNAYLGAELRLGVGTTDETITSGTSTVDTSIDYYASAYWRPESANEVAKLYGLLGFSTISISNGSDSDSESGFSYGAGVGFLLDENWNLNFEYRFLLDDKSNEFSALSANLDYRF